MLALPDVSRNDFQLRLLAPKARVLGMEKATGIITLAQEGRIRLSTEDGRSELFILAHDAPMEPQDLPRLVQEMARVTVHYSAAEGRLAGLAHDLTAPGGRPRRHIGYLSFPRR